MPHQPSRELERRLAALDRIYAIFDKFIASYDLACRSACATCCTANMTLTTLEGYRIVSRMNIRERKRLVDHMKTAGGSPRFQPRLSINTIAKRCRDGKPIPDETPDPSWGKCLLLAGDLCSMYALRPFGCRCMVSRTNCRQTGYADMDDFILTVNNLFMQTIEHMDPYGGTGNLIDILLYFFRPENLETYRHTMKVLDVNGLAPNRPIPVLMVPPEHGQRVERILEKLRKATA
ncbi:MAG: YkgJ family cysteine cluster protein [Deltaproteobacteria bacterium]|nr:YkgJ family cysteine cluster protein [Deltaproteobacteria bacterium]